MPFQQQRDYWCCADQTAMERDPLVLGNEPTQMVDSEDEAAQFGDSRGICEAARQQNYSWVNFITCKHYIISAWRLKNSASEYASRVGGKDGFKPLG